MGRKCNGPEKQQQPSLTRVAADAREVVCCEPALGAAAVSGNCADGLLGMKYGNVTWPFGAWMFIWKLVFSLFMDSRCFWFFIKEFGNFLLRFYDFLFGKKERSYTIWSARFCKKRRLKVGRKGWLHRLCSRVRSQPGVGPRVTFPSDSENLLVPQGQVAGTPFFGRNQPDAFPDLSHLPNHLFLNNCRGGGGGSATTARKRWEKDREQALLQGLAGLLAQFKSPEEKGKNKQNGKGKGKPLAQGSKGSTAQTGKSSNEQTVDDVGLVGALGRLVQRAQKRPEGLLDRLIALVDVASARKNLESEKRKKKKQKSRGEQSKGAVKGKGKKGNKSGPQTNQGKGKGPVPAIGSTWAHIVGGKKVSGDFHGPIFYLRPEDWKAYTVVPHVQQFGNWVDKEGKTKPFIFVVHDQEQLDEAAALVKRRSFKFLVLEPPLRLTRALVL